MTVKLDTIYIAASAHDGRFTRICVASIRNFYPNTPIKLLIGGALEDGLAKELARYWDVGVSGVPRGDWGWGFVKLEPLFGQPGERFLVLDSDTAFAGRVLKAWPSGGAPFLVDDEQQTLEDTRRLYYDWRAVAKVDASALPPAFVFNSGQWFGTAGVLTREDFAPFVDWSTMPPRLHHPTLFMPGDQGVLNYVLNQRVARGGVAVDRRKIMRWPGHGMAGVSVQTVSERTSPPLIVHWAGYKGPMLRSLPGADILQFFEEEYYSRMPSATRRRVVAAVRYPLEYLGRKLAVRVRGRLRLPRT
jgi:hypothetical protein